MPRKCSRIFRQGNADYWPFWNGCWLSINRPKQYDFLHVLIQKWSTNNWNYSISKQPGKGSEIKSWLCTDSLNFPMVIPYLSYSPPLTFRSNKTYNTNNTTSRHWPKWSVLHLIFNFWELWLYTSPQNRYFRHVWKPSYILALPIFTDWYASTIQISYLLITILYLLIMSTFIQIPNRINQLTKQSKLEEIFVYAAIRSQIKSKER